MQQGFGTRQLTKLAVLITNNKQFSGVALNGLIDDHAEDRVGLVEVRADRKNHISLFNLRECAGRCRYTQGLEQSLGNTLVAFTTGVIEVLCTNKLGEVL